MSNPFINTREEYVRDLNVLSNATYQAAHYLHLSTKRDYSDCLAFVQNKATALVAKNAKITRRKQSGDRAKALLPFDKILTGVVQSNSVFTPNMVVYDDPTKNLSFLAELIDDKMVERKIVKKVMSKAEMEGNHQLASFKDNQQTGIKTFLNSISGAHASPHNSLFNKTAHSTLTSGTRIATSYGNASTERFLSGNRHYYNKEVTLNNIISVVWNTNIANFGNMLNKYAPIHLPSVDECMECVNRSTFFYWDDPVGKMEIYNLFTNMNPLERAAFIYTGDMYQIAKYNPAFVKGLVDKLISPPTVVVENPDEFINKADGDIQALCGILCAEFLTGLQLSKLKEVNPAGYQIYANTVQHISLVLEEYRDFIKVCFATDNLPPSIYHFPTSIRRVVVGSDTDSVMFTCQDWVEWYCGKLMVDDISKKVSAVFMYFNAQIVAHNLALTSRQMGVEEKNLFRLQMKNEYSFLVYMVANRCKHYVTLINAKEGNFYSKAKLDIKGVALKDSKKPPKIMKTLEKTIYKIMDDIVSGDMIEIYALMQRIANMEHEILTSISSGSIEYLSKVFIKAKGAYQKPMSSNFAHYEYWNHVFGPKYGNMTAPPYQAVKLPNVLNTGAKFNAWIDTLDPDIGERYREWMAANGKKNFEQFLLPIEIVQKGIPKEFIPVIDKRRLVAELMEGFVILLEIIGMYWRNKDHTRLLSDEVQYRPEHGSFLAE